ncbi:putative cysteine-rich receptor-like protein kinase 35 isoform X1 [Capsella rubella]|uniref:putative cysteine-rich receptor-like protein kinase 35 isoform X1 n=1 Tax=Capsella rubella TaxID=81985 RepID=UPI000CD4E80D|nr:putative cysteine-rich receptor-like protein kinase 35 isoform X1 [Capsella rubella]
MKLKKLFLPLFLFLFITLGSVSAQTCFNGYFKPNSTFDLDRRRVLSSLASNVTTNNGFYSTSIGKNPNQLYTIGMCIPGSKPEACSDCIKGSSDGLLRSCPNQTVGYVWPDLCMVRYSNISFSGSLILEPSARVSDPTPIDVDLTLFDRIWEELMSRVIAAALRPDESSSFGHKYYAAEVAPLTTFQTIYAMVQCTPDVSSGDCEFCMKKTVVDYKKCCRGNKGGAFVRPFCFIRWDLYPFAGAFENITVAPPPSSVVAQPPHSSTTPRTNTTGKDGKTISTGIIVAIPTVVILVLLLVGYVVYRRRKAYKRVEVQAGDQISREHSVQFSFKTIEDATDNFSESNMIGQGGFGEVYKGTLLDGTEVAVKRLSKTSGQGTQEFKNEAVLVTKLQHRNLVRLLGFCLEGEEKILVYEFVQNKSLDYFLFDPKKQGELDWTRRYTIIGGIARGILYLHQDSRLIIIHRDLKASNILLDADMNPKVADFGMARIFGVDQSQANTRIIVGTYGYMSPEYAMRGHFSMKSDVYSFGILILEIISGKKISSFYHIDDTGGNLVTHAWRLWRDGSPLELVDPAIGESYQSNEAIRCIHIALLCVQEDPADRPTLQEIIVMLTSRTATLHMPRAPGFCLSNRSEQSTSFSIPGSINDVSITDLDPR